MTTLSAPNGHPVSITSDLATPVRTWERVLALGALAATAPVLITAGISVRILSGQSPLIAHRRVGWEGQELWVWKLRTMWGGAQQDSRSTAAWMERLPDTAVPESKAERDERVTSRFAAFCADTRLTSYRNYSK